MFVGFNECVALRVTLLTNERSDKKLQPLPTDMACVSNVEWQDREKRPDVCHAGIGGLTSILCNATGTSPLARTWYSKTNHKYDDICLFFWEASDLWLYQQNNIKFRENSMGFIDGLMQNRRNSITLATPLLH